MLDNVRKKFNKSFFNLTLRRVTKLGKMNSTDEVDFTLLSVCSHDDLVQYQFALRSFCQYLMPTNICIIDDGTLTNRDKQLLNELSNKVDIIEANHIKIVNTPSYISWKRLTKIIELCDKNYVVQLDSDILVRSNFPQLKKCILEGRPFIHGTLAGKAIIDKNEAAIYGQGLLSQGFTNLQTYCEAALNTTDDTVISKYVRGSGGLYGFSKGSVNSDMLVSISQQYHSAIGERWFGWGSEQVAVCTIVANLDRSVVLDTNGCGIPRFDNLDYTNGLSICHFIGSIRYDKGLYRAYCKEILNKWMKNA